MLVSWLPDRQHLQHCVRQKVDFTAWARSLSLSSYPRCRLLQETELGSCHESLVQQESWLYSCHTDFGDLVSAPALLKQHPGQFVTLSLPISAPLSQISSPLWLCGETEAKARDSLEGAEACSTPMPPKLFAQRVRMHSLIIHLFPVILHSVLSGRWRATKEEVRFAVSETANTNNTSGSDKH